MDRTSTREGTKELTSLGKGDPKAVDRLMLLVLDELHRLAASFLRQERPGHTLQTTALVHEVYLRPAKENGQACQDRAHFLAIAARVMRQVLVNHAVARKRVKREGKWRRVPLDMVVGSFEEAALDLVSLKWV